MPGFQEYFDLYSGVDPFASTKQAEVDRASREKQAEIDRLTNPDQAYQTVASRQAGSGYRSASEIERDYRDLSPFELEIKYGSAVADQLTRSRADAGARLTSELSEERSTGEAFGDFGLSILSGAVNGIGGLGSLGVLAAPGLDPRTKAETAIRSAQVTRSISDFIRGGQSDAVRQNNEYVTTGNRAIQRDNQDQFEDEGDKSTWAKVRREGRNALEAAANILGNPVATADVTGEGVGSLFVGSGVASGLRKVGSAVLNGASKTAVRAGAAGSVGAGRAFDITSKIGSKAAFPAAIAAQEAGGAYQSTVQEALVLVADRPDLSDDEKIELANAAGVIAAKIQAPVAAITSLLVVKFESAPLNLRNNGGFIRNIIKETIEEGIQSGTGAAGTNIGIADQIDPSRDLGLNIGEQAAYGAIGGAGAAGVVGAPGVAVRAPIKAAELTGRAAVGAARAVATPVVGYLKDRGEQLLAQAAARSPVSREQLSSAYETVKESAPGIFSRIQDALPALKINDERKQQISEFTDRLTKVVSERDFSEISRLADVVKDKAAPLVERLRAGITLQQLKDQTRSLLKQENDVLGEIEGTPDLNELKEVNSVLATTFQNPEIAQALDSLAELATNANITPDQVDLAIGVAQYAPEKSNPDVNGQILLQAEQGQFDLTPENRNTLEAANTLVQTQRAYKAKIDALPIKTPDVVSDEIRVDEGGKQRGELSALSHSKIVQEAMRIGDLDTAKIQLNDFMMFAQLMQNKVGALNTNLREGDGTDKTATKYQNLTAQRVWRPVAKGLFVSPRSPNSVSLAQRIAADAEAVAAIANDLAQRFPQLEIQPVKTISLDEALQGDPIEIARSARVVQAQQRSASSPQPASASASTPARKPVEEIQEELPLFRVPAKVEAKQAPEPADTGQPKGGDQSTDASRDENPTPAEPKTAPSTSEATAPESDQEADRPKLVVEQAQSEVISTPVNPTQAAFPDLLGSNTKTGLRPLFAQAYKVTSETKSRIFGKGTPVQLVRQALSSTAALKAFIGEDPRFEITDEIARDYRAYLGQAVSIAGAMAKNLDSFLDEKNNKAETKTRRQHLIDGTKPLTSPTDRQGNAQKQTEVDLNNMVNSRALNLVEERDGKLTYNPELLGGAILAGLQWVLTADRYWSKVDAEQASKFLGIPIGPNLDRIVTDLNKGMGPIQIKPSLAKVITQFWGLTPNSSTDEAVIQGIAESMAAEVIRGLISSGLVFTSNVVITEADGLPSRKRTLTRYRPFAFKQGQAILAYPTAIEDAVLSDPERNIHIGQAPTKVAQTQMNNPKIENTAHGRAALRHEGQTPYRLNLPGVKFFRDLGPDLTIELLGEGDLSKRKLNINYKKTLEGRNDTLKSAYDSMMNLATQVENRAKVAAQEVGEVPIYYDHNFSAIGRMQMLGLNNPQGSKFIRHLVMPTWSTLDLSSENGPDFSRFALGLAQGLGVKVHNKTRQAAINEVIEKLNGPLAPVVTILREYLSQADTAKPVKLTAAVVDQIKDGFRAAGEIDEVGFHAVMEYARFLNARQAGSVQAFETPLYVEADGITNGPIMAMMMATIGKFTPDWLTNVAKGGIFFHAKDRTTNEYRQLDKVDLYEKTSNKLLKFLGGLEQRFGNNYELHGQLHHLTNLMQLFLKDIVVTDDGRISFERGIAKNPLTITLYGSGAKGIAGNLIYELSREIYEKMSSAVGLTDNTEIASAMFPESTDPVADMKRFSDSLTALTNSIVIEEKGKLRIIRPNNTKNRLAFNVESFTFSKEEGENLQQNMLKLFVEPMRDAINETVGEPLIKSMELLRKATQVQSIFQKFVFEQKVLAKLTGRPKGSFLSREEQGAIFDEVIRLFPFISTEDQTFFPAGSTSLEIGSSEFGRAFNDQLKTPGYLYGPDDAGVGGIPMMIVGMGDGQMMQRLATLQNSVAGTLKVFDGINLPLSKMEDGSYQANQSAFEAMMSNPLKAVLGTYQSFIKNASVQDMPPAMVEALTRSLFDYQASKESRTPEQIQAAMDGVLAQLKQASLEVDARHAAIRRVKLSVDQMAAVGSPFGNDGEIDLTGLNSEQITTELNRLYDEELIRLGAETQFEQTDQTIEESIKAAGFNHGRVVTLSHNQLLRMLPRLKIPKEQEAVLRDVVRSLLTKDYKIVIGSLADMSKWAESRGLQRLPAESVQTGKIGGLTVFGDKHIYLVNPTSEVMTHELIHAATFEKVVAYYKGQQLGENAVEQVKALQRIELLMEQFLGLEDLGKVPVEMGRAYRDAKTAIDKHLNNKSTDPELSKAAALNEFMAWALTNRELIKLGQSVPVDNILVRLTKEILAGIKQLIWGKKYPPKIAEDMHSNLRFNTAVLLNAQPTVQELISDMLLFQSTTFGSNQRLADIEALFNDKIVSHFDATLPDYTEKQRALFEALQIGIETATEFQNRGFSMDMQESTTFQMIVATLATSAYLDPNALSAVQDLFTHVTETLKFEDFLEGDGSTATQPERHRAEQMYNAVLGNFGTKTDTLGRSTLLSSFLALAMVNEEFRQVLGKLKVPKTIKGENKTLDGILENLGISVMDKLSDTMSGANRQAPEVASAVGVLADRIVSVAQQRQHWLSQVATPAGNAIDAGNKFLVNSMKWASDKVVEGATTLQTKTNIKAAQYSLDVIKVIASIVNEEKAEVIQLGLLSQLNKGKVPQILHDFVNELIGRNSENYSIYDMIKIVRSRVQQNRQQFRENLPKIMSSKFTRKVTDAEWAALFKGMAKTDLASLVGSFSLNRVIGLMEDPSRVTSEIVDQENATQALDPSAWPLIQQKAKELAEFMNSGKVPRNLLRNANAIAHLWGESRTGVRNPSAQLTKAIDQLVSLYALQGLPEVVRDQVSSLVQEQPDGVSFALSYLIGQRIDEQTKVAQSRLAQANHYKGFIPSESAPGLNLIVAEDQNSSELTQRGYKRVGDYSGSQSEIGRTKKGYYFSPVGRPMYNQGILQNVRPTASGVDPLTGFTNIAITAGQISDLAGIARIQRALRVNGTNAEGLMPVYDTGGNVVAFERSIDPLQQVRLKRNENLAENIGIWRGRQIEEYESQFVNQELVSNLAKLWQNDRALRKDEYINLFGKISDPVLRDAISLINVQTRAHIENKFARNEFWVRKDMLNDALGYRTSSIGDLWTENTRWSPQITKEVRKILVGVFGIEAYKRLVTAEKFLQNFVTDARVTIVVKSVVVPMANLAANFIQLMSRGVPILDIAKGMPKKTAEIESYVRSRLRKIELEAELRAAEASNNLIKSRQISTEIKSINDAHKRLSIWPLINAGEFASISDIGLSQDEVLLAEGRLNAYIEKLTSKLPDSFKTLGRYGVVAKDTALYRGLQRAVEYGDFLGKAVLYDDLTKRQGLSKEEALAKVTEEFVNYDRLPGRARGYLESIGLIWFWHFKIRTTKIALSILRNNPLHAFMSLSMPGLIGMELPGSPVTDNGFSVLNDGRLGYSLGIDQALRAHNLNPWVNLVS